MALYTARPSVGTTATLLGPGRASRGDGAPGSSIAVYNPGPTEVVIGNASVTASAGLALPSGATFQADLDDDEHLYGVVATGTQLVHVLETGV